MTAEPPSVFYQFAHFELQPDDRRLLANGAPVEVGRRAFDLLVALVERGGRLVTKSELLERVWPKLIVEEGNLQVQVWALRKILGHNAIATIPGHGYRFTLPLSNGGAPSPTSTETANHNLPHQLTSFIGREKEIAEIKTLLGRTRLLTLTGSGGCGKTRLAIQVARLLDAYPDGIWLVELVSTVDPGLVPQTVARVLGVQEERGKSLSQSVIEHLTCRHLLLVLDNAEHLLAACAQLTDAVLRQCSHVVVMVTSREKLGIAGEQTYRVPGLSVPQPGRDATAAGIASYESVRLFIERSRLNLPLFAVTNENAPAVALVCSRLDGIPLAIELAAARVRSMSVEEVSRRLDQRFRLLTGGSRTAPRRQQTLRALIDWSHDLLSDAEKALLCRVSIFSGGWTPEAAEEVCMGEGIDAWEMLDLLTSLTDKSLLVTDERSGVTRYRLLETVREYARERLLETAKEARWQGQHLAYFLVLAERAEPHLRAADAQAWLDGLEMEHDNLRAALAWSTNANGDAAAGLRLAGMMWWFWLVRGYLGEGRRWLSRLVGAAAQDLETAAARAKALNGAGVLAFNQGDYSASRARHEEALALQRDLGDRGGIAGSLSNLGGVAYQEGDYLATRAFLQECLSVFRELGDQRGIAASLSNLGSVAANEGDDTVAQQLLEESLAINRELGHPHGTAIALTNLGELALSHGDYPAARVLAEESLAIRRELGDRQGIAISLNDLGAVAQEQGEFVSARALFEESLAIRREVGDRPGIATSLEGLAYTASTMAEPGRAARIWGKAERLREEIGVPVTTRERPHYDRRVAAARAALGDDVAFDLAWQEGRAMTLDQAIQYATEKQEVGASSTASDKSAV